VLAEELDLGTPVIVLEPSCASVFLDELQNLFPNTERARRLREQTQLFGEFLMSEGVPLPPLSGRALLHGHCHHKSLGVLDRDKGLLRTMGMDVSVPDSGCCGMAGSFGFEQDKYEVSVACGERVLLPAVRAASPDTIIVSDGFSCREQISQLTDRTALHTAEVLRYAIGQDQTHGRRIEDGIAAGRNTAVRNSMRRTLALAVGSLAAVTAEWILRRHK
jgi:Fe-S oxidoreductase